MTGEDRNQYDQVVRKVEDFLGHELERVPEAGEEIETVEGTLSGFRDLTYTSGHGWGR